MIGKKIGLALCFAAIIGQADAQELGIGLNGGLQGMRYPLQNGESKPLPGATLGMTFVFKLNDQWGLLTGIAGGLYRTQANLQDSLAFSYGQVDDAGSAFRYNLKFKGYKETQQFFAASIPLLLQYHTANAGIQWWFNGGGKIFFPFNTSVQVSAEQLSLSGYYPDFNLEVSNLPQHGFGTVNGWKSSATAQLKPAGALSAATGVSFGIAPGTRLYAGIYIDYGLTDLRAKSDSMPLVTYSPAGINKIQANGVLNMQNSGQAKLFSFGLQLRLSFGSKHKKSSATPTGKEEPQPSPTIATTVPAKQTPPPTTSTPPPTTPTPPPTAPVSSEDLYEALKSPVVFGIPGETSIPQIQQQRLDDVADLLKQYSDIRISIVGHICNSDNVTEYKKVGIARARAVADYLQSKGIDRRRMDISPAVSIHPFVSYDPAANYRNRKVVITVE